MTEKDALDNSHRPRMTKVDEATAIEIVRNLLFQPEKGTPAMTTKSKKANSLEIHQFGLELDEHAVCEIDDTGKRWCIYASDWSDGRIRDKIAPHLSTDCVARVRRKIVGDIPKPKKPPTETARARIDGLVAHVAALEAVVTSLEARVKVLEDRRTGVNNPGAIANYPSRRLFPE